MNSTRLLPVIFSVRQLYTPACHHNTVCLKALKKYDIFILIIYVPGNSLGINSARKKVNMGSVCMLNAILFSSLMADDMSLMERFNALFLVIMGYSWLYRPQGMGWREVSPCDWFYGGRDEGLVVTGERSKARCWWEIDKWRAVSEVVMCWGKCRSEWEGGWKDGLTD